MKINCDVGEKGTNRTPECKCSATSKMEDAGSEVNSGETPFEHRIVTGDRPAIEPNVEALDKQHVTPWQTKFQPLMALN